MYHSHGKGHHIGLFETFEEAVYARKCLEKRRTLQFAIKVNFPNIVLDTAKQKID